MPDVKQKLLSMFTDVTDVCSPGVYLLFYKGEAMYAGQSTMVAKRIGQHYDVHVIPFDQVYFLGVPLKDMDMVESYLISVFNPKYNRTLPIFHEAGPAAALRPGVRYNPAAMKKYSKIMAKISRDASATEVLYDGGVDQEFDE